MHCVGRTSRLREGKLFTLGFSMSKLHFGCEIPHSGELWNNLDQLWISKCAPKWGTQGHQALIAKKLAWLGMGPMALCYSRSKDVEECARTWKQPKMSALSKIIDECKILWQCYDLKGHCSEVSCHHCLITLLGWSLQCAGHAQFFQPIYMCLKVWFPSHSPCWFANISYDNTLAGRRPKFSELLACSARKTCAWTTESSH